MKQVFITLFVIASAVLAAQTLDNTFNGNGIVLTEYSLNAQSMCVQQDGKILVGGPAGEQGLHLIRYTEGGQLDQSFGNQGLLIDAPQGMDVEKVYVAMQGDKVLAGGQYITQDFQSVLFVKRYNQDGTVDPTFGNGGTALCTLLPLGNCGGPNFNDLSTYGGGMIRVYPDGKIQQAGTVGSFCMGGEPKPFSIRYAQDGGIDTSFYSEYGGGLLSSYEGMEVSSFALAADSSTLVGGHGLGRSNSADSGKTVPKVMWFPYSGYNGMGFAGELRVGRPGFESFETAALENYGDKLLVAGTITENGKAKFAVARTQKAWFNFSLELKLDSSFGTDGLAVFDVAPGGGRLSSVAVDGGKIILGGRANTLGFTGNDMLLMRLNPDGSADGGFGSGGKVTQDHSNGYDDVNVLRFHEGKLVVAGNSTQGLLDVSIVVMRYGGGISGISEPQGRIAAHPNPAASEISFEMAGEGDWEIYDVRSSLVGSGRSPRGGRQTVDVSGYAPGAYFIRCETEDGASVGRFVKK